MLSKKIDFNTEDLESLSNSDLKRIADYWMRKYLLKKAERNNRNQIFCPLKKRWYNEDKTHVAHYIDRNKNCTKYKLDNVCLISLDSNVFDARVMVDGYKSLHHKDYGEYLGEEKCKELFELSENLCIFTQQDYIDIIKSFKND